MDIIETGKVLAKIQAFDNRNVEPETTLAWQEVLEPHTLPDALKAVSDYFRTSSAWIMPAHLVERVRAMEEDRMRQFKNGCHLNPSDEDRMMAGAVWSEGMRALNRAVRTGVLSPAAYEAYQSGAQPLEAFLSRKAIK